MKIKLASLLHSSVLSYAALLLNFIFATLLIHFSGKNTYALFAHATAFITIFGTVFTFGHMRSFVRFDGNENDMVPVASLAIIFWLLVITIVSMAFIGLYASALNDIQVSIIIIIASTFFCTLLLPLWQWKHQVIAYNYWIIFMATNKVFWLLLLYVYPENLPLLFKLNAFSAALLTLCLIFKTQLFKPRDILTLNKLKNAFLSLVKHTITIGAPFWIALIASTLYIRVDILLLNALNISQVNIGLYAYIETIIFAILLLPGAISNFITRSLIAKEVDGFRFWRQYELSIISVSCLLSLGTLFILPEILPWLLGTVSNIYPVVIGFIPGIAFAFLATFFNLALVTDKHLKQVAFCNILTAVSCVLLNLILIPRFGIIGSAYATSLTYCVLSSAFLFFCIKNNAWKFKALYWKLIAISLAFSLGFISWAVYLLIPFAFFFWRWKKKA